MKWGVCIFWGFWWKLLSSLQMYLIYSPYDLRMRAIFLTLTPTLVTLVSKHFPNQYLKKHILVVFSSISVITNEIYHSWHLRAICFLILLNASSLLLLAILPWGCFSFFADVYRLPSYARAQEAFPQCEGGYCEGSGWSAVSGVPQGTFKGRGGSQWRVSDWGGLCLLSKWVLMKRLGLRGSRHSIWPWRDTGSRWHEIGRCASLGQLHPGSSDRLRQHCLETSIAMQVHRPLSWRLRRLDKIYKHQIYHLRPRDVHWPGIEPQLPGS